jgi:hypothetical protein
MARHLPDERHGDLMIRYLGALLAALLALLLVACGGSGEANEGNAPSEASDAATTNRVRLDGLTFAVHETPD